MSHPCRCTTEVMEKAEALELSGLFPKRWVYPNKYSRMIICCILLFLTRACALKLKIPTSNHTLKSIKRRSWPPLMITIVSDWMCGLLMLCVILCALRMMSSINSFRITNFHQWKDVTPRMSLSIRTALRLIRTIMRLLVKKRLLSCRTAGT